MSPVFPKMTVDFFDIICNNIGCKEKFFQQKYRKDVLR